MATTLRRPLVLAGVLALLLAALILGAPPRAHAGDWERCGDSNRHGAGWFNLRANDVACTNARKAARIHTFQQKDDFDGWHCRDKQIGDEVWKAKCHRRHNGDKQKIKFRWGA